MAGPNRLIRFAIGDIVYSPFSNHSDVFVIESGYVIAFTYESTGKRRIHLIYGPGSYFPVLTTFKNTEQRASYEAISSMTITKYGREEFLQKLSSDLEFCNDILRRTVEQLAIFAERVIDLQATKLEDRLLESIRVLIKEHGTPANTGFRLPYKLKQHHFADMLGVERESITRALSRLKQKHLIAQDDTGIITIFS
jgi:CRP/FNR family transcriptional regulator